MCIRDSDHSSYYGRFIPKGIEIENHPSLKYASVDYLSYRNYKNAVRLLKSLKLKIKIPKRFIHGDTLIINDDSSYYGRFIPNGIEIENHPSLKYAIYEHLHEEKYENALQLLKSLQLKIKIPKKFIDGDTLIIDDDSSTYGRFISNGIEIENHSSLKCATAVEYLYDKNFKNALELLKSLKLKIKISQKYIDGDTLIIDLSLIHI